MFLWQNHHIVINILYNSIKRIYDRGLGTVSNQVFLEELEYIADDSDFYSLCERIRFRIAQAGLDFTQACLLEGIHTDIVAAWIK